VSGVQAAGEDGEAIDEEERKSLDVLDEQLNRFSQNSENRYSENPLVPLIEEADEEEVDPQQHQFQVNHMINGEQITAVGKTHKPKRGVDDYEEVNI